MSVNGVETQLNPWVGIEMEALKDKDWKRTNLEKYEPNDLMNYLKKKEGEK